MRKRGIIAAGQDAQCGGEGRAVTEVMVAVVGLFKSFFNVMKKACFTFSLLVAFASSTQAALSFSETFSYANGPLTAVAPAGTWTSFGGTANQLDVLAGRARLTMAESQDVGRAIPGGVGIGATIFFGFDLIVTTSPAAGTTGNVIAHLGNSPTPTGLSMARVYILPATVAGTFRLGIANGATTPSGVFPPNLTPNTIYRVVVRYVSPATGGPPQSTLWVNPCSIQDTGVPATDQFNPATLTSFVLRQETGIGLLDIDNLRVATTFPEVGGDSTPPTIVCPSNIVVNATSAAGAVVTYPPPTVSDNTDPNPAVSCAPPSGSTFPIGNTTVLCTATDRCLNRSTCTFVVTVRQATPIALTCPADMKVGTLAAAGVVVNYPPPTVAGGCPPVTVACVPPSGSAFPIGTTTVTCTASDACGQTATCQFRVTVFRRFVEIDRMDYGLADVTLVLANGAQETIRLAGPTTVHVMFDGEAEGEANDSDGDGLDEVDTEMVSMSLTGGSSLGPVSAMLRPGTQSRGLIEEAANLLSGRLDVPPFGPPGSTANSFFDVFVEFRVRDMVLRPAQPLRMAGVIRHKPPAPGDTYVNPFTQPVPLLDANGNDTGIRIIREVHTPNPEKERDFFSYSVGKINIRHPNGQIERVIVAGPTEVMVDVPPNGAAADTDGDGLDQVPTEMTALSLLGNSSLGPVMVMLDTARCRTFGEIEERVNSTPGILDLPPFTAAGSANSHFDLCIKIVVGGRTFRPCNNALVRVTSIITHKPPRPGEPYMNLINQEVPLCDENGLPTGIVLTGEMHTPNPPKEIDFFPDTVAQLTVRLSNGAEEVVTLRGPTRVEVCIDDRPGSDGYGLAADTDADGRDQVPTEMTLLTLTGNSSVGPVQVNLRNDRPSLGEIEERVNATQGTLDVPPFGVGLADSFFDIWTEITLAGQTYRTAQPLHMAAVIRHKPPAPGDEYVNPFTQPVELIDANGRPTGIFIVREVHTPNPDCTLSITCPPDMTVGTLAAAGAVVNYPPPVVVGTCPPITVVCNPPSGSVFPIGTTTVTCTATDRSGKSASCSFRITVFRRFVEVDKMPYGTAQLSLLMPNGQTEVVTLAGPTTVEVYMDGEAEGDANDSDGDGLDDVSSRMTEMDLRGNSSQGPVQVMLDPDRPSLGGMEEQANTTPGRLDAPPFATMGALDSFFDVFTEIRVAGRRYRPESPLRMAAVIRHKPPAPGDTYVNPFTQPIMLLDENGNPTGIRIVREVHTPNPEKEIDRMPFGTAQITLRLANGATEVVTLAGPTTVEVCIPPDGTAADTDGDGRDQVPTKMTAMDLRGGSSMGPVRATLDPTRMTLGEIEETANGTPGTLDIEPFVAGAAGADSYFDVHTELTVGGLVMRPAQPIRMQAIIRHKPPGPDDTYVNPFTQPIELLDANGRPTGIFVVREVHTPNPPKERDFFSYSLGKINLRYPNGQIERVIMGGPTTVDVCVDDRPGPGQGRAADLDGDGLEEVPTEMTQLMLTGNSSQGPVQIMLDPNRPTRGGIEEKVNGTPGVLDLAPFGNQGCANSYFDVIPLIKIGGRVFCPRVPLHIEAMICHKPPRPGEAYMNLINQAPVELVDCATGQGTGIFLTGEMHTPNLPKERDFFSYSVGKINIRHPDGRIERIIVAGPTLVEVCVDDRPGADQALAADTDGDGLDEVPTVMTQLNLMGNSSLGPVMVSLNPNRPTTGEIEEKVNGTPGVLDVAPFGNQGCANSFFDVHAIIKVGGRELCPSEPLHIAAMICHKPPRPGEAYMNLFNQEIRLLDCATGQPTGYVLTGEMHSPNPPKEIDFFPNTVAQLTVRMPNGAEEIVTLRGPTRVEVCIDDRPGSDGYGLAADTDGDGRDQVPTEMTLLTLTGNSSLGPVQVSLRNDRPSTGEIEETANTTPGTLDVPPFAAGLADSFFDIWTEITLGGQTFRTPTPLHMASVIRHKPPAPGDTYVNPFLQPVPLLDANGNDTGIRIVREVHTPNPNCTNTITCPSNVVVWTCNSNGMPVNYPAPTASSSCNLPLVIACVPPSGSTFPIGNTTVTCTARDPLGNTASCTFTVRVIRDTTPPVLAGCPSNIVIQTCRERERVVYPSPTATDDCDPTPTVACNPPSGTVLPIGSHVVICRATDDCGNETKCEFRVEIRRNDAVPQLTITRLPNNRLMICWSVTCTGWVLQCTRDLNPPIQWQPVTITPTTTGGSNCVIVPLTGKIQVYRLARPEPEEVYAEVDTFPPQGVYEAGDEVTVILRPGPATLPPLRARWFRHPIPPPEIFIPRPPPCLTCPPDTFRFQTDLHFQVSQDDGMTWMDISAMSDVAVQVMVPPIDPDMPGMRSFDTEMLQLDVRGGGGGGIGAAAAAPFMLRESPTRRSTGQTTIRQSAAMDGTFMIDSFFDVFIEVSMDGGQTWLAAATPVGMKLKSKPAEQYAESDAFPPTGSYTTPRAQVTRYDNGILTRWYLHPIPPDPFPIPIPIPGPNPPCLSCPPVDFDFTIPMHFQVSVNGGQDWMDVSAMSDVSVQVRQSRAIGATRFFDMEMDGLRVQPQPEAPMGAAGVGLPAGVRLRESPSRRSTGKTTLRKAPDGTFMIGSFFDIFTDLSLDGGQTWHRAIEPSHVELGARPRPQYAETEALPPAGVYASPSVQLTEFSNGIIARWYRHPIPIPPIIPRLPPCLTCPPEPFEFITDLHFQVSADGGRSWADVSALSKVGGVIGPATGVGALRGFNAEMLQLDAQGVVGQGGAGAAPGIPFMLRESPTLRSRGHTEIQRYSDGTYRISSFFDISTELSLDGGQTWHRSKEPTHVSHMVSPPEQYEAAATFPPPGSYDSPAGEVTVFDNGILARWYLHRIPPFPPGGCPFCPPPPCLTCPPEIYRFDTDIRFQWSRDAGQTWNDAAAPADVVVEVDLIGSTSEDWRDHYETEILKLDISGGTLPLGVMIRESPTRKSLGMTTLRQVPGLTAAEPSGYRIGSFFDIFTDISLDGGQTWSAGRKPSHVILTAQPPPVGQATATFPPAGSYNSPRVEITRFPNGLLARRYRHSIRIPPIIPRPWPCLTCPPDIFEFPAPLLFEFSVNGGQTWQEGQAQSLVQVMVDQTMMPGGVMKFDTEMLRLEALIPVAGTPGVRLRESPTRRSMGLTRVTDSPSLSRPFNVDSFFDIFTELSLDGGQTWSPSSEPTHVELQEQ